MLAVALKRQLALLAAICCLLHCEPAPGCAVADGAARAAAAALASAAGLLPPALAGCKAASERLGCWVLGAAGPAGAQLHMQTQPPHHAQPGASQSGEQRLQSWCAAGAQLAPAAEATAKQVYGVGSWLAEKWGLCGAEHGEAGAWGTPGGKAQEQPPRRSRRKDNRATEPPSTTNHTRPVHPQLKEAWTIGCLLLSQQGQQIEHFQFCIHCTPTKKQQPNTVAKRKKDALLARVLPTDKPYALFP